MNKYIKGFTLIEVMIVVAIIAILASIAYPNYQQHVVRGNRINAQSEMLQIGQSMANIKLRNGDFAGKEVVNIYGSTKTPKQGTALYDLAFSPSPTTANEWTLIAKPIASTTQDGNGWICLNNQGQKSWSKGVSSCSLSVSSDWSGR